MDRPEKLLNDIKSPEKMRAQVEEKLIRLNEFIKKEYQRQGASEQDIPIVTIELFKSLRGEEFEVVARELPRQKEMRRRDLLQKIGLSAVASVLGGSVGGMIAGSLSREKLEKLAVRPEQLESMSPEDIQRRGMEVAKLVTPGLVIGGAAAGYLALRSTLKTNRMQGEINLFHTRRFLGMFALFFNLQPGEILQLSDTDIESKLRQLKFAGCDLEEMLELLLRMDIGESMRADREKKDAGVSD